MKHRVWQSCRLHVKPPNDISSGVNAGGEREAVDLGGNAGLGFVVHFKVRLQIKAAVRPESKLQWFGTVDQGKQLEIAVDVNGVAHVLATVIADEQDESLWVEFYIGSDIIQIPITQVQRALSLAIGEVHSEAWYERNVYPKISD